jgi:hypothetical protein
LVFEFPFPYLYFVGVSEEMVEDLLHDVIRRLGTRVLTFFSRLFGHLLENMQSRESVQNEITLRTDSHLLLIAQLFLHQCSISEVLNSLRL